MSIPRVPSTSNACRTHILVAVLATLLSGCATATPHKTAAAPVNVDFDAGQTGQLPPHFTTALTGGGGPIAWALRDDPTAPVGHKVLIQESHDDASYRFPLCIYQDAVARNVSVSVQIKSISGSVDQAAGLVLRYNPENYYIARANALEDNIDVFKTVNGQRLKIQEVRVTVTPGVWHTLCFAARGSHLTVIFDGTTVVEADDTTFAGPGKVGLWTKADSVSAFSDLKIQPLP